MKRTDLLDTSPEIHLMRIQLLREKTVDWRIQKAFELTDISRRLFPEQTRRALRKEMGLDVDDDNPEDAASDTSCK
ncbi:MAG: hypothetical protein ACOYON_09200 [Fimbriimonas sp.]